MSALTPPGNDVSTVRKYCEEAQDNSPFIDKKQLLVVSAMNSKFTQSDLVHVFDFHVTHFIPACSAQVGLRLYLLSTYVRLANIPKPLHNNSCCCCVLAYLGGRLVVGGEGTSILSERALTCDSASSGTVHSATALGYHRLTMTMT